MQNPRLFLLVGIAIAALPVTSLAIRAESAGSLLPRQQAMREMALASKAIATMFDGKILYDKEKFQAAASVLVDHAGKRLSTLFAEPSSGQTAADEAKIAAEHSEFDKIASRLEELAIAFDEKAANAGDVLTSDMRMGRGMLGGGSLLGGKPLRSEMDLHAIPAEHLFHMMLETCTTCHSKYRTRQ